MDDGGNLPTFEEMHRLLVRELGEAKDTLSSTQQRLSTLTTRLHTAGALAQCEMAALREEVTQLKQQMRAPKGGPATFCGDMSLSPLGAHHLPIPPDLPGCVCTPRKEAAVTIVSGFGSGNSSDVELRHTPDVLTTPRSDESASFRNATPRRSAVSPCDLKTQIRKSLVHRGTHKVTDLYHKTGWCQAVARSPIFEQVTLAVIAFNTLWIAVETDHNPAEVLVEAPVWVQMFDHGFCLFFTAEWLVRLLSFEHKTGFWRDRWFVFDSLLVLLMVFETWAMSLFLLASSSGSHGALGPASDASILRILRLLRLSRMARMARLFRAVPELLVMIKGMAAATRSVVVTLGMITLIIYVFGITFKQLLAGTEAGRTYFATVPDAMLSLVFYAIILEGTPDVVTEVGKASFVCGALFFLVILLASFTLLNMLVGVMCETVRVVSTVESERMTFAYTREKLAHLMRNSGLDADGNERLSKAELKSLLNIPDACIVLRDLGVDVVSLVDVADIIFENREEIDFATFMAIVLQLRGCNKVTVHDLVMHRKFVQQELSKIHAILEVTVPEHLRSSVTPTDVTSVPAFKETLSA